MNAAVSKAPVMKYRCELVREPSAAYMDSDISVLTPESASEAFIKLTGMDKAPSEQMWVLFLDIKANVKGYYMASAGSLTSAVAESRNVFRGAILANSHSIIIGHNHPSGDPTPSSDDVTVTKRLIEAGRILGIRVLDHIIVGHDGSYVSMQNNKTVDFN